MKSFKLSMELKLLENSNDLYLLRQGTIHRVERFLWSSKLKFYHAFLQFKARIKGFENILVGNLCN